MTFEEREALIAEPEGQLRMVIRFLLRFDREVPWQDRESVLNHIALACHKAQRLKGKRWSIIRNELRALGLSESRVRAAMRIIRPIIESKTNLLSLFGPNVSLSAMGLNACMRLYPKLASAIERDEFGASGSVLRP